MRDHIATDMLCVGALIRFIGCPHALTLDLAYRAADAPLPLADRRDAALRQRRGDAPEPTATARPDAAGKRVVEIPRSGDLAADAEATRAALAAGGDVIRNGAVLAGRWGGWPDLLERVAAPSSLGAFSYEATDTAPKTRVTPEHVVRLALLSDLLAEVQGAAPARAHVALDGGARVSLRLSDHAAYARAARARFEDFLAERPETRPTPCAACARCRWKEHCESTWAAEDSLFRVAGIAVRQVKRLERAGIRTLAALAAHDGPVRGMAPDTRERLTAQARLQHARTRGGPTFELRTPVPGRGFALLPRPARGDLFYVGKGDPSQPGGLRHLHGVRADGAFHAFRADDAAQEAEALRGLLVVLRDRLARFPEARLYHYGPREIAVLRRLAAKHGIGEAFLDRLMRERRLVDLHAVVHGGLVCAGHGHGHDHSVGALAALADIDRQAAPAAPAAPTAAGGARGVDERGRVTGDPESPDEIDRAARRDCLSMERLRAWLVSIRPDIPRPDQTAAAAAQEVAEDAEAAILAERVAAAGLDPDRQATLLALAGFHARERKAASRAVFDSRGREEEALIDDPSPLAGLTALGPAVPVARSRARTYRFPDQATRIAAGRSALVADPEGGVARITVTELDAAARTVTVKLDKGRARLLADRLALHPEPPTGTDILSAAVADVVADQCGPVLYRALDDLLARRAPHLAGGPDADLIGPGDPVAGTVRAIHRMQETVLPIQGPPGSGKTRLAVRAILSLLRGGHRVGVSSGSHAAIRTLLAHCMREIAREKLPVAVAAHGVSADHAGPPADGGPDDSRGPTATARPDRARDRAELMGGTACIFAREEHAQAVDWLFVDDAAQVSLGDLLAMGRAARNIVLLGDPCQLPCAIAAAHPHPAHLSCMDWLLGDRATFAPDRGIVLPESHRMHPALCRSVSELFYEGRLAAHPATARQAVTGTPFPPAGAGFVPVDHAGCGRVAPEEVDAVAAAARALLAGTFTGTDGTTRAMRAADILVTAPFASQVTALRAALPKAIRVGTIDSLQGLEAPVCLVSMTASSAEDIPGDMELLYAPDRLNVAISRARALALVFASPRLRAATCDTVERMRMVNAICALPVLPGDDRIPGHAP